MKRDIRSIRKQFRLTETEEKQILDLMREKGEDNFSDSYLRFELDFYKYSALDIPLTFITDDILCTMAMSQKHYFKLNKSKSLDGRDHYFVFSIKMNKDSSGIRQYEYQRHCFSL